MYQKWFVKFWAENFLMNDIYVDHNDQMKTLLKNNQFYTMKEVANITKIPKWILEIICLITLVIFHINEKNIECFFFVILTSRMKKIKRFF